MIQKHVVHAKSEDTVQIETVFKWIILYKLATKNSLNAMLQHLFSVTSF